MDIFNKKKIKELENKNSQLKKENNQLKEKNNQLIEENKISDTNITSIIESNKKLIEWIYKILDTFGTQKTNEIHVSIPIYKARNCRAYDSNNLEAPVIHERIEIPSITICKYENRY